MTTCDASFFGELRSELLPLASLCVVAFSVSGLFGTVEYTVNRCCPLEPSLWLHVYGYRSGTVVNKEGTELAQARNDGIDIERASTT